MLKYLIQLIPSVLFTSEGLSESVYDFMTDFLRELHSAIHPSHETVLTEPLTQMESCTQLATHNANRPDENELRDKELPAAAGTLLTAITTREAEMG